MQPEEERNRRIRDREACPFTTCACDKKKGSPGREQEAMKARRCSIDYCFRSFVRSHLPGPLGLGVPDDKLFVLMRDLWILSVTYLGGERDAAEVERKRSEAGIMIRAKLKKGSWVEMQTVSGENVGPEGLREQGSK